MYIRFKEKNFTCRLEKARFSLHRNALYFGMIAILQRMVDQESSRVNGNAMAEIEKLGRWEKYR